MESLTAWITAIALCIAVLQYRAEAASRLRERQRLSKAQASKLTVWAASDQTTEPKAYGVVIDNSSGSMFHDVEISATLHRSAAPPLKFPILAPGRFFVELTKTPTGARWEFAQDQEEHRRALRPYMNSTDYKVESVRFADNLNRRWRSNDHAVLERKVPWYAAL